MTDTCQILVHPPERVRQAATLTALNQEVRRGGLARPYKLDCDMFGVKIISLFTSSHTKSGPDVHIIGEEATRACPSSVRHNSFLPLSLA